MPDDIVIEGDDRGTLELFARPGDPIINVIAESDGDTVEIRVSADDLEEALRQARLRI